MMYRVVAIVGGGEIQEGVGKVPRVIEAMVLIATVVLQHIHGDYTVFAQ